MTVTLYFKYLIIHDIDFIKAATVFEKNQHFGNLYLKDDNKLLSVCPFRKRF